MKTEPITPARIAFDGDGPPRSLDFDDIYHARAGALAQAEHVFLRGNGLPERWRVRRRFVVLETGFGLGNNFLATWAAWRADPERCARLHMISVDRHPPVAADLARAHASERHAAGPALRQAADMAAELIAAWPPLTGDLHRIAFDGGRVELLLAFGDAAAWFARLQLQADAIFLDGFAPERNPQMWSDGLFSALSALAAPGATAATWSCARVLRDGLARHGFEVTAAPGFDRKREMTVARFAPRYRPPPTERQRAACPDARAAVVIGAGLAGAAAALALAEEGLEVTVLDAAARPAAAASGNRAGLLRAAVARDDGPHARWHRAAALAARVEIGALVAAGSVPGRLDGLLHLADDREAMSALAERQRLPAEFAQVLDAPAAAARAGVPLASPAWFFPGGGWVEPAALVQHWLEAARVGFVGGSRVHGLRREGRRWLLLDGDGRQLAATEVAVLAAGAGVAELAPHAGWPLASTRGQVTLVPPGIPGFLRPALPLARNGYAIPLPDGALLCGATQSSNDTEPGLRAADHARNLAVLARLTGAAGAPSAADHAALGGRVGWRCHSEDRLPLVGPAPAVDSGRASAARLRQPRHVRREPGLVVLAALGARGITSAVLGARVLAAQLCGAPLPVDADLLDAIDAARFVARAAKRR